MSMESSSSSSSFYLSKDLLIEILLCLSVQTLLRFKSVCKSWFLLIESSDFIDRHTALSSSSNLGTFIFQANQCTYTFKTTKTPKYIDQDSWNIFSISCDDDHKEFDVVKDLDLPPSYVSEQNKLILMMGSCNGLICLYNYELRDVFLWNPAIHQFRLLPRSSFTFAVIDDVGQDFVAFGFDVETKDYKVVLVTYQPIDRVQVYSLSTDSWRTLEDVVLPTRPRDMYNGGYLNGSYYCMGYKTIDKPTSVNYKKMRVMEVLSFDFTKEIFKTMPLPDEITDSNVGGRDFINSLHIGIIFLGEKIATTFHHMSANIYELWVLNEVGVKESWTKLYRIGPYGRAYRPIGFSNNGEFIFVVTLNGQKLWLLNPSTLVMKEIQWDNNQRADVYSCSLNGIIRVYVYRRSLVPVCSTRKGSTSELSLKFDTLSVDNAVFNRHKQS